MEPRNAIITGASRGIGVTIARALAARNTNLLLVARSEPDLQIVARELRGGEAQVSVASVDLARPDAGERIFEAASATLGSVDVLINNAAVESQRRFHTLDPREIEHVLRVDLVAPIQLARLVLPSMLDRGYGRIVNIASIAGRNGFPFTEAYAAAKDGLIAFSRVIRNDYRRSGVSASAIILGPVKGTGIGQRTIDELGLKANTAFMVGPEQVARAVLRAVDKGASEIIVMRGPGRMMKGLMDAFPSFGGRMNRVSGTERLMHVVADRRQEQHEATSARRAVDDRRIAAGP
jgi:3-oxoacyl-[acyl-carrier protein] reductase